MTHIIRESSKLLQSEYKSGHNDVVKVIHWEFKFEQNHKLYEYKSEFPQDNETQKDSLDFKIRTEHFNPGRRGNQ